LCEGADRCLQQLLLAIGGRQSPRAHPLLHGGQATSPRDDTPRRSSTFLLAWPHGGQSVRRRDRGRGPGGYVAAIRARQLGLTTALVGRFPYQASCRRCSARRRSTPLAACCTPRARIIHEVATASADRTPSLAVLAPFSSPYCRVCLRRASLRLARSGARSTRSRRTLMNDPGSSY
jgi:hypothetical protein